MVGGFALFSSGKIVRGGLDPAEMLRALREIRGSRESHYTAGY